MIRDTQLPATSTNRLEGFSQRPDPAFPVRKVGVLDLRDLAMVGTVDAIDIYCGRTDRSRPKGRRWAARAFRAQA